MNGSTRANIATTLVTQALLVIPIWVSVSYYGLKYAYEYIAGDSYYYLTVAQNVNRLGFFTYDQERLCNSFHPLWQLWCVVLFRICTWLPITPPWIPAILLASSTLFIALAIAILAKAISLERGSVPVLFVLLPLGVYALIKIAVQPGYGTLWSYADGMESGLVLVAYALVLYLLMRPRLLTSAASALTLGLAVTFLVFSRLDHVFFAVALFPCLALQSLRAKDWKRLSWVFMAGAIAAGCTLAYMALNRHYFGVFLPLSGIVKSSFPHVSLEPYAQTIRSLQGPRNDSALWRLAQVIVPFAFAVIAFVHYAVRFFMGKPGTKMDFALLVTAIFVVLLASYNYFFVSLFAQGHWYYPVSVIFVSLLTLHLWAVFANRFGGRTFSGRILFLQLVSIALVVSVGFYVCYGRKRIGNLHEDGIYDLIAREAKPLKEFYADKRPKIIEYSDGAMAYATGFPALPAYLLVADKELLDSVVSRHTPLLQVALDRGYDRVIVYTGDQPVPLLKSMTSDEVFDTLQTKTMLFISAHLSDFAKPYPFTASVEYISPSGSLAVIRLLRTEKVT
jgi:hypothetical protein